MTTKLNKEEQSVVHDGKKAIAVSLYSHRTGATVEEGLVEVEALAASFWFMFKRR